MRTRLRVAAFIGGIVALAVLAGVHDHELRFVEYQPPVTLATHEIKSIRLTGIDDSGSCDWCRTATAAALIDQIERTPADGSTYAGVVTFGTVARVIFGAVVNDQTKPLMLTALKGLPAPNQGFTHPGEALKTFQRQIATLFSNDRALQSAWHDGQVALRAVLIWDGKATLDPGSDATAADFRRDVDAFWEEYATPIASVAIEPERTGRQGQRTNSIAHVHEHSIAVTDLTSTLAQLPDTRRPARTLATVTKPRLPTWLVALDAAVLFGGATVLAMSVTRRSRARRRRDRETTFSRFAGVWSYRLGPDSGSFQLTDGLRLRIGKGGDRLQRLPARFVVQVGQSGSPQVKAEAGEVSVGGRRLRQGDVAEITTPCQIYVGANDSAHTVELRRVGRQPQRHEYH